MNLPVTALNAMAAKTAAIYTTATNGWSATDVALTDYLENLSVD